jgi:hypothetical protein
MIDVNERDDTNEMNDVKIHSHVKTRTRDYIPEAAIYYITNIVNAQDTCQFRLGACNRLPKIAGSLPHFNSSPGRTRVG